MKVTIKTGKGVLGKDGKPYALRTLHVVGGGWISPAPFTVEALLNALKDKTVGQIEVIDDSNTETTLTIER